MFEIKIITPYMVSIPPTKNHIDNPCSSFIKIVFTRI
jgi:hypothetical protein